MQNQQHWQKVYTEKKPNQVSWYQKHAQLSIRLIAQLTASKNAPIIDIGGGASNLVDDLLNKGYQNLSVLDVSQAAINHTQTRLGDQQYNVNWLVGDINEINLPQSSVELWHDRAVFHFLIDQPSRQNYLKLANQTIKSSGHLVIATFAEDGPDRCSGLAVKRHSKQQLADFFAPYFDLLGAEKETHLTPSGSSQNFIYCWFQKR